MYLKPDSFCVSGEFESGANRSAPRLPTQPSYTQKINRKSNARAAIFHLYQNVPVDQHNRYLPLLLINIAPVIFIYFLC